jgi:hypothetical protein
MLAPRLDFGSVHLGVDIGIARSLAMLVGTIGRRYACRTMVGTQSRI